MATDIYKQHDAAFSAVSAYVIARDGARVATIAFKFPRDGAGRLYAYVHWYGVEMVRGYAAGGGYDKRSAACASAARKIKHPAGAAPLFLNHFVSELAKDDRYGWDRNLRDAGFEVWQAV
jgi:hypothetical protein